MALALTGLALSYTTNPNSEVLPPYILSITVDGNTLTIVFNVNIDVIDSPTSFLINDEPLVVEHGVDQAILTLMTEDPLPAMGTWTNVAEAGLVFVNGPLEPPNTTYNYPYYFNG